MGAVHEGKRGDQAGHTGRGGYWVLDSVWCVVNNSRQVPMKGHGNKQR